MYSEFDRYVFQVGSTPSNLNPGKNKKILVNRVKHGHTDSTGDGHSYRFAHHNAGQ